MEHFVAGLVVHKALTDAQEIMTDWLIPFGSSDKGTLDALLPVLDNVTLVRAQRLLASG